MKLKFNKINKFLLGLIFLSIGLYIIYLVINCCKSNSILEGMTYNNLSCEDTYPKIIVNGSDKPVVPDNFKSLHEFDGCSSVALDNDVNLHNNSSTRFSNERGCWPKNLPMTSDYGFKKDKYRTTYLNKEFNNTIFKNSNTESDSKENNNHSPIADAGSGMIDNNQPLINNVTSTSFKTSDGRQGIATPENTIHGIHSSSIPHGHDDLYVLKSEIVPPVCPACPSIEISDDLLKKKCTPCPPCARCPEPSFKCEKVPNYSMGSENQYLPMPFLNNFSTFGS